MRFLIPLLLLAASLHAATGDVIKARVVAVHDGDTIYVETAEARIRVRLWGIDCPELRQPGGDHAAWFTSEAVLDRTVTLREMDVDRYGRMVAIVTTSDGRVLNELLLRSGNAWWYTRYAPEETEYGQMQDEGKHGGRGLWSDVNPVAPWEWRKVKWPVQTVARRSTRSRSR